MFFDSHAHLTYDTVYENLPQILTRAQEKKVEGIVNICTDKVTLERGLKLAEEFDWIYTAGATTPHDVEKEGGIYFHLFEEAARTKKLHAIGETGLDYHYKHSSIEMQKAFLKRYLELALACDLPVIFHCRDAFDDLFAITESEYKKEGKLQPAVLHCFTGTMKEAERALERNWYISFSGIVTFKRSQELREIAKEVPLNQLLIETDTPYLAPQSHRGKPNEPSFIGETAQVIAEAKELTIEEVAKISTQNVRDFLKLS